MAFITTLTENPTQITQAQVDEIKDALVDGLLDINTAGLFINGTALASSDLSDGNSLLTSITGEPIEDLSDVTITSISDNEVLAYDAGSSTWINQTASEAGLLTEVADDTTPSLSGDLDAADNDIQNILLAEFQDEHDNGNSGTSDTIDWNNGNNQKSTLTGNVTFSFTAPSGPSRLQIKLIQDGTGSRTVTWPTIKWIGGTAPTLSTAASSEDIITLWYDGTSYYGIGSLDFS